jgi:hypothetical protein
VPEDESEESTEGDAEPVGADDGEAQE